MKYAKQTIVLFQNSLKRELLCSELKQCEAVTYQEAESTEQVLRLLDQNIQLISFSASQSALALIVANLRNTLGVGGLVVVIDSIDSEGKTTDLLLAGADVVLVDKGLTSTELLAWDAVLVRRAEWFLRAQRTGLIEPSLMSEVASTEHEPVRSEEVWYLMEGGWSLKDPKGRFFDLTSGERLFLESFVGQVDKRIEREELLEKNAILNKNSRAIDSLISRLRRKLKEKNSYLPIKAIHGWGYSFNGLLVDESKDKDSRQGSPSFLSPSSQDRMTIQGLIESSSVGHVVGLENTAEPTYKKELINRALFEEHLRQGRFEYVYHPLLDTQTGRVEGAFATLEWKDNQGHRIRVEYMYDHLESLGLLDSLCSWAVLTLNQELITWDLDYAVQIPIYVGLPINLLLNKHLKIDTFALPWVADKFTVILQNFHEEVDMSTLSRAVAALQKSGVHVWARYEGKVSLPFLQSLPGLSGLSFWRLTDEVMSKEQNHYLSRVLELVQRQNWPTLVVDINEIEQRRFAQFLGARYLAGGLIAMALSRDGLLLSWACRQENSQT